MERFYLGCVNPLLFTTTRFPVWDQILYNLNLHRNKNIREFATFANIYPFVIEKGRVRMASENGVKNKKFLTRIYEFQMQTRAVKPV